jgi:hypothetical protein
MEHQALIHFRIKTHGVVDATNCHPFMITNNFAFIHNGTISGHGTPQLSDTYMFNEDILKPMVAQHGIKMLWQPYTKALIEEYIGWSKLIFLDSKGNFNIYNEAKGEWSDGVWYSNASYKPKVTHKSYGGYVANHSSQIVTPEKDVTINNSQTYYLKRKDGKHIYIGDYVEIVYNTGMLRQNDWVEIVAISESGVCTVVDAKGATHNFIPSTAVRLYESSVYTDYSSYCGV